MPPSALTRPAEIQPLLGLVPMDRTAGAAILLQIPIVQLLADTFHHLANTSDSRGPRAASSEQDPHPPHRTTKATTHDCCILSCEYDLIRLSDQGSKPTTGWQPGSLGARHPGARKGRRDKRTASWWHLVSSCRGKRSRGHFLQFLGPGGGSIFVPSTQLPTSMF